MVEMFILSSPTLVIQHILDIITKNQGWQIELVSLLKNTLKEAFQKYTCSPMVSKVTTHGFQAEVFTTIAQASVYSALTLHVHVT